jgi:1,4-dihydroxy-2-naphthoyl-CoA hydrolase
MSAHQGYDPTEVPPPGSFMAAAGMKVVEATGTRVTARLHVDASHHTPFGVVHGGVYAAAVESAASIGASLAVLESGRSAVGVTNTTDFVRPVVEAELEVVAEALQQGRTLQLWEVRITRADDGRLVAHGRLRLQNVPLPAER